MGKHKALVLLSGGLDSRLAVKLMEEQLGRKGTEAVFFLLPFGAGCCSDRFCVFRFCQKHGIRLHIIECSSGRLFREYMGMVRKPRFQRGTAMNPCMDCHAFMLKKAGKLAKRIGADIIATGEVLGQRPMSQQMHQMRLIEREAGLEGRVLKPLSAKLLPETDAEKEGIIDRSRLLDIQGRQRKRQMALAKKYGIDYPTPGGGCLLTDKAFSRKLINMLRYGSMRPETAGLLKMGRHFRSGRSTIIVGRDEKENALISALARKLSHEHSLMEVSEHTGPVTLVICPSKSSLRLAARLTARYSDSPKGKVASISPIGGSVIRATPMSSKDIRALRV